jgi:hypothetical protein
VVAHTTGEGAALVSVRLVGVVQASHCGGGDDRWGRSSGIRSLERRGLSQLLWRWARIVRSLLWPLFARSGWD